MYIAKYILQEVPKSNVFVYFLSDPRTNDVRYVGKTIAGIKRLRGHFHTHSLSKITPKNNWLKSLLKQGLKPIVTIVEYTDTDQQVQEIEKFYISYLRFLGCNLTNLTDGGEGHSGYKPSKEHTEKRFKKIRKPIIDLDTLIIYPSIKDAEKILKIRWISPSLRGYSKSANGKYFAYVKDIPKDTNIEDWCKKRKQEIIDSRYEGTIKPILCLNNNVVYPSISRIPKELNISLRQIYHILKGSKPSVNGYRFQYA